MILKIPAIAGTLESSDVQIAIAPNPGGGIDIDLESDVKAQFGEAIEATVRDGLQAGIFVLVSAAALTALRPLVRKYLKPKLTATNVDSVIGTVGIVTIGIDNIAAAGQVKLGGMEWTARSTSGEPIPQGTRITVDRIEGVKAFVSPAQIPANM